MIKTILTVGVALTLCARAFALPLRQAQDRPNFIVILVDDLGLRDVGYAGNPTIRTPHIDRAAQSGITFTQAYAAAPNCAPTRACLMTGQYTPRHGVFTVVDERHAPGSPHHKIMAAASRPNLATEAVTLAEALKAGGYATGMVGMWNLGRGRHGPETPTGQGFDVFVKPRDMGFEKDAYFNADGQYLTDRMTDEGIAFMEHRKDRPFFLYLAYHAVHGPFDPKPALLEACRNRARGRSDDPAYAATVEALDQNVGRLMDILKRFGIADNTYLLFTSDNGGTHRYVAPLRGGKGTLYEGGLRVPAFMTGPGISSGKTSDEPISTIDIYPTLLALAGVPAPGDWVLDGVSLAPLVKGDVETLSRERLFWHFPCYIGRGGPSSAVREGKYKLIEFFESRTMELYDLSKDVAETRNLADKEPEHTARLYGTLKRWQSTMKAPCPTRPNPDFDPSAPVKKGRDQRGKGKKRGGGK